MNKLLIKYLCIGISCLCWPAFCAETKWIRVGDDVAVEGVSAIRPAEIWNSARNSTYHGSEGLVVDIWPVDVEAAGRHGKWFPAGLVLSGLGDMAEKPVAVRVWSKGKWIFDEARSRAYEKAHGKVALFFYPTDCGNLTKCENQLTALVIELQDASQVLMNKKYVGKVR